MGVKTLAELRSTVRSLYGDYDGVTAGDAEVDLHLKDGVNRVLQRCPWLSIATPVTTGALNLSTVGSVDLGNEAIGQIISVELQLTDGTFRPLEYVHPAELTNRNAAPVTTVDGIYNYFREGSRMSLYPAKTSGTVVLRLVYGSNSIGTAFPTITTNPLPTSIPVPAEDAAILYAVAKLHQRDENWESANFILQDFESRLLEMHANHYRPQRGQVATTRQTDFYLLDLEPNAW